MASRTTRSQSRYKKSPDRLSPEILLSIFLNLDSQEIVIFRGTCKKWLDVIDTNKLLWRNLEWIGKSQESIEKAVEMFDQKSSSSLEVVSIEDQGILNSKGLQQSIAVVSRSRSNLKSLSILTIQPKLIFGQLLEQANSSPKLERLVLWDSSKAYRQSLPLTRLVPNGKRVDTGPSASHLKVLWLLSSSSGEIKQILDLPAQLLNSLISFALYGPRNFQEFRPFLSKFSGTLVHLRLTIIDGGSRMEQPLFCPNLKILETNFHLGVSLYFDCPKLKHLILSLRSESGIQGIPPSVEELWMKSFGEDLTVEVWEPLLSSCPRMEVLKLIRSGFRSYTNLQLEALIQVLEKRQEIINKGEEIQGLQVAPLRKLILHLEELSKDQLERAQKVVEELIDVKDSPNFFELEY